MTVCLEESNTTLNEESPMSVIVVACIVVNAGAIAIAKALVSERKIPMLSA